MSSNEAIEIVSLSCKRATRSVLSDISFSVNFGEFVSIIGPNGAGKTSLLLCLLQQLKYNGSITLAGKDLRTYTACKLAKTISYVPQTDGTPIHYTVWEFAMMGRYAYAGPFSQYTTEDYSIVNEALESTSCLPFANRPMDTLSGGERQKVFIAAALAQEAKILLLDEPTTFLDPRHEQEIYQVLTLLHRNKQMTIISVSHNLNRAALASDRILALKNGKVAFHGTPKALMQESTLQNIYSASFLLVNHPCNELPMILPETF